jgi:hypothetical protein
MALVHNRLVLHSALFQSLCQQLAGQQLIMQAVDLHTGHTHLQATEHLL